MHIGIEACTWANRRGYGRFTRQLVGAMIAGYPEHRFTLVVDSHTAATHEFPTNANLCVVPTTHQPTRAASADSSRKLMDMWRMSRAIASAKFDVMLFPTRYTFVPVLTSTPVVLTIHDATDALQPDKLFPNWKARLFWRLKSWLAIQSADHIVTVSHDAKQQISSAFGLDPDSIEVISEGPDATFKRPSNPDEAQAIRTRYSLPPDASLLLYVGGISPHKNLDTLVRSLVALRQLAVPNWHLVLVGDYSGDSFLGCYQHLQQLAQAMSLTTHITFTGYVPDEDLVTLYHTATLLVLPSKGEGFGLPVLEAMTCGLPVTASNSTSIPEVLGGAGLLFNPDSDQDIAQCLGRLLNDRNLRQQLRELGLARASHYSWEKGAATMIEVLRQAAGRA